MSENPEEHGFPKQLTKLSVDFDRWYTDVIRLTEMADYSGVRGCMVIRPYGYAMWENIQRAFDDMIKESGHENAYFPLLIPHDYFSKEAEHVEGFAPEVAWVQYAGPKPVLKPPSEWIDCGVRPMWPITGISASRMACTIGSRLAPPSSFTACAPARISEAELRTVSSTDTW